MFKNQWRSDPWIESNGTKNKKSLIYNPWKKQSMDFKPIGKIHENESTLYNKNVSEKKIPFVPLAHPVACSCHSTSAD
jgi:hypothetical protein